MAKIYHLDRLLPNNSFRAEDEQFIANIVSAIENGDSLDIRNIAKQNYSSPSSISRLARRGGFNNFKEMIFFLSREIADVKLEKLDSLSYVSCSENQAKMDEIFNEAFSEKRIYLYGEGFCTFLVNYTYRKLLLKKIYAIDLDGVEIDVVSNGLPHTMLIFSQSGENSRGLGKMEECRRNGGKVISFTASRGSSFVGKADLAFTVDNGPDKLEQENQSLNYFYGNCLNLVEYLIHQYC
ncbi:MAG: SIS domain-containing protein [Streptococcaceae bacterium]|jgi:DNA-binding MurR/RpiR family transcriptional regulator|nr:SIS domain-containing protein [Streptococcaceae bacterium]